MGVDSSGTGGPYVDELWDEITIDDDVRRALDQELLNWKGVSSSEMFGGIAYEVEGTPFAILLEGVVACGLSRDLRARALGLAGVSPFAAPFRNGAFDDWVQLLLLLPEDLPTLRPWLEAGYSHAVSRTSAGPECDGL